MRQLSGADFAPLSGYRATDSRNDRHRGLAFWLRLGGAGSHLIAISVIDIDHQIIPDSISLPLIWAGLFLSLFHESAGAEILFVDPSTAIAGGLAGYLSLWSIYHLFRLLTGKEGMGYGDFKLLAALGAWLGWQMLPLIILLSAFVGAIVGVALIAFKRQDRNVPIPFGPYLAAAGWIAMLYGPQIMDTYLDYMR